MINGVNNDLSLGKLSGGGVTPGTSAAKGAGGSSFADTLKKSIEEVSKLQQDASDAVQNLATAVKLVYPYPVPFETEPEERALLEEETSRHIAMAVVVKRMASRELGSNDIGDHSTPPLAPGSMRAPLAVGRTHMFSCGIIVSEKRMRLQFERSWT